MRVERVGLDVQREPLGRPFGFKGGYFTEKWLCRVELESERGARASGVGGLAVLWSDPYLFAAHTEVGGNLLMASLLESAMQRAREVEFETPIDLLEALFPSTLEDGRRITGRTNLSPTFALNALVALDNAAWTLYAREHELAGFDEMIPSVYRPILGHRHAIVARIPAVSYASGEDEILALVDSGHHVLKLKIGAPGEPGQMLRADMERLTHLHRLVGSRSTEHTRDGRLRYYLDANGRYRDSSQVQALLEHARQIGAFEQIVLLEEPFPEGNETSVDSFGVRVVADESVRTVEDVARRAELGYGAIALKPAGKTLSRTLQLAQEAARQGLPCFVADSACTPRLLDWNRNVAARLAPLPGEEIGLLEVNGPENYKDWQRLVASHPCNGADWLEPRAGLYILDERFYRGSGGVLAEY